MNCVSNKRLIATSIMIENTNDSRIKSKIKDLFFSSIETMIRCTRCQHEKTYIEHNPIVRIIPQNYLKQLASNVFQMETFDYECLSCHYQAILTNETHLKIAPFILALQLNREMENDDYRVYPENIIERLLIKTPSGIILFIDLPLTTYCF